jgi:hypothetical protein
MQKLAAIKTAGGKVAEITLGPLGREHLGQLVADALRCESELALPLAQLVHEKTGGLRPSRIGRPLGERVPVCSRSCSGGRVFIDHGGAPGRCAPSNRKTTSGAHSSREAGGGHLRHC